VRHADGRTASDGASSFVWDARNQLASMNAGIDSFQYDPFGRRVAKTISGTTTNYLYDGPNPVQELSGTTVTANLMAGLTVDEFFTRTDSAGTRSFLADPLGSTVAPADSAGASQTTYTHEPFGNTAIGGIPNSNPYQYTGRENDATGLYFYRARYYSPIFQRFMSQDPLRFDGGSPNLYDYVFNTPTNLTDVLDLSSLLFCRSTNTLTAFDDSGRQVASFPASNNAQRSSLGPRPNGAWDYAYHKDHPADPNGPYGDYGIFIFRVPGRAGLGVHSGRRDRTDKEGRRGYNYATNGCIRTTDDAMKQITDLNKTDPLKRITVGDSDCN
jgi:RHS repeat-associated protein